MILTDIMYQSNSMVWKMAALCSRVFGKTKEMGAQTTIHCVVADENVNGKYYSDCREDRLLVNRSFYDEKLALHLYEKTKHLLKL